MLTSLSAKMNSFDLNEHSFLKLPSYFLHLLMGWDFIGKWINVMYSMIHRTGGYVFTLIVIHYYNYMTYLIIMFMHQTYKLVDVNHICIVISLVNESR